jgi:hypothetical protein
MSAFCSPGFHSAFSRNEFLEGKLKPASEADSCSCAECLNRDWKPNMPSALSVFMIYCGKGLHFTVLKHSQMCSLGCSGEFVVCGQFTGCRYVGYQIHLVRLTYYCLVCDVIYFPIY